MRLLQHEFDDFCFCGEQNGGVRAIKKEYESNQKSIVPKGRKCNLQKYILIPFSTLTIKSWVEREMT